MKTVSKILRNSLLSLCLFKKKFCQMCEKSEFLWRERPVLYHVMPFRSSNYTNFSNYIWYGISKKRHVYLLKLPTIESVNKKKSKYQAHSSKFFDNFLNFIWMDVHMNKYYLFDEPKLLYSALNIIFFAIIPSLIVQQCASNFFCNRFYKVYTYLLLTYSTASSSWIYVYITLKSMRKYEFLSSFQIYTSMF